MRAKRNSWEIIRMGMDIRIMITVVKWSLCQDGIEDEKVTVVAAEETNKERV